jgi:protein involved in polysaccharide export with SLBB domain
MLNYRPFFIIGEVEQPGAIPTRGRGGRAGRRLSPIATHRARERHPDSRRLSQGESQPADPSTSVFAGDIEVRQRFF